MQNLVTFLDALYSRLVLRDFLAKIIPGSIILLSFFSGLYPISDILFYFEYMPVWLWILFFGFSWLAGIFSQATGEAIKMIRPHDWGNDDKKFYKKKLEFEKCGDEIQINAHIQQLERLTVIKEATGNGFMSLAIATILYIATRLICPVDQINWWLLPTAVITIFFLYFMHDLHVTRHRRYIEAVIENNPESNV